MLKRFWTRIVAFFSGSETIFWARLQTALGVVAAVVTYVDPALLEPVLPAKWFPLLVLANGIFTEYLRRRRAEDL